MKIDIRSLCAAYFGYGLCAILFVLIMVMVVAVFFFNPFPFIDEHLSIIGKVFATLYLIPLILFGFLGPFIVHREEKGK